MGRTNAIDLFLEVLSTSLLNCDDYNVGYCLAHNVNEFTPPMSNMFANALHGQAKALPSLSQLCQFNLNIIDKGHGISPQTSVSTSAEQMRMPRNVMLVKSQQASTIKTTKIASFA